MSFPIHNGRGKKDGVILVFLSKNWLWCELNWIFFTAGFSQFDLSIFELEIKRTWSLQKYVKQLEYEEILNSNQNTIYIRIRIRYILNSNQKMLLLLTFTPFRFQLKNIIFTLFLYFHFFCRARSLFYWSQTKY